MTKPMFHAARRKIHSFLIDESGPTSVEYAVILALIIALAAIGIGALGEAARDLWFGNSNSINHAVGG